MDGRRTLLHLVGSAVDGFHADLSRLYAGGCLDAIDDPALYESHIAYVDPDGRWRFPTDLSDAELDRAPTMGLPAALAHIETLRVDVMVPQMFCLPGMTAYRAVFDALSIPYLGNTPDLMAISADKAKTRAIVAAAGVSVPSGVVARAGEHPDVTLPVVVKPVDADNSAGVTLVREPADLDTAIDDALEHSQSVLIESYVELGREVRCGIVVRDGELVCLPLEEYAVDALSKPIRRADDKLARSETGELYLVAKDDAHAWIVDADDPITERVWEAARRCHTALGARHYSLFDFRIDPDGDPWFLEAGLYCSFSRGSVVAVMAAAAGIDVPELFATTLRELTRERTSSSTTQH